MDQHRRPVGARDPCGLLGVCLFLSGIAVAGGQQPPAAPPTAKPQKPAATRTERVTKTFSVYALSRGKGVPAEARDVQQKVQDLVEADRKRGVRVTVAATRIGIEGERRLCVTYESAREAARALARVRAMVKGVDLVNLVEEPCTPRPPRNPKEEEP